MLFMSVMVIELAEPPEDELDEPLLDEEPLWVDAPVDDDPELPLSDELELLVPAATAEPTDIGSAVMTPSVGADTAVSPLFFFAVP